MGEHFTADLTLFRGDTVRFAVVSDTHICSRQQQMSHLHSFYRLCSEREIDTVFNPGDLSEGNGKVYTFAVYHTAFHPEFVADLPYTVAVVALDEGPHLLTNIVGCPPEAVKCDMPVAVVWEDVDEKITLPKFRPLSS